MKTICVSPTLLTLMAFIALFSLTMFMNHALLYQNLRIVGIRINQLNHSKERVRCIIVLRERSGRLGNRLFLFASALGLAWNHSCSLDISQTILDELKTTFEVDLPAITNQSRNSYTHVLSKISNHCSFIPISFRNKSLKALESSGFWQVQKYFSHYSPEIRKHLRFKKHILNRVHQFFNTTISHIASTRIGIHIRRGDYLALGRRVSNRQYIINAITYFERKYHSVIFIIVTDDRNYCRKEYGNRTDVIFTPSFFDPPTDLAVLSQCDHVIITVGTFGWWGGFLLKNSTGEVITDAKPDFTPLDVDCRSEDYFPPWFSFLSSKNITMSFR